MVELRVVFNRGTFPLVVVCELVELKMIEPFDPRELLFPLVELSARVALGIKVSLRTLRRSSHP